MADVRINALATTATTSASDDYLAIDGSANGTRKLSAYSPTFGGTVTGSVAGPSLGTGVNTQNFLASAASGFVGYSLRRTDDTNGGWLIGTSAAVVGDFAIYQNQGASTVPVQRLLIGTTGNTTLAGNLTVSGSDIRISGNTGYFYAGNPATLNGMVIEAASNQVSIYSNNAQNFILKSNGNVLVGATIDGGQKAQINGVLAAGTTTGDRVALSAVSASDQYFVAQNYWNDNGTESVNAATRGSWRINMCNAGTTAFKVDWRAANAAAGTFTNLLGIDTSGNATFAGTIVAVGNSTFKRSDNTGSIRFIPTSGVSAGSDIESFNGSTSAYGRLNTRGTHLQVYTGTSANTLALTVDDSQRTILSGALRLNNAYTAGAVVTTGYVTIQDSSGTTYKIPVGT